MWGPPRVLDPQLGGGAGCRQQQPCIPRHPPVPASPATPAAPLLGTTRSMGLATPAFWARWGHSQDPLSPAWLLTLAVPPARQRMAELGGTSGGVCASPGSPAPPGCSNRTMGCPGDPHSPHQHTHWHTKKIPRERRYKGSQRCLPPCQTPPRGSGGNPGATLAPTAWPHTCSHSGSPLRFLLPAKIFVPLWL